MYVFTTRALDFVYTTVGRVKFVYFFRISPVKLKFSMAETPKGLGWARAGSARISPSLRSEKCTKIFPIVC